MSNLIANKLIIMLYKKMAKIWAIGILRLNPQKGKRLKLSLASLLGVKLCLLKDCHMKLHKIKSKLNLEIVEQSLMSEWLEIQSIETLKALLILILKIPTA